MSLRAYNKSSQRIWVLQCTLAITLGIYAVFCALLFLSVYPAKAETIHHKKLRQIEATIQGLTQKGAKIGCQLACLKSGKVLYSYHQDEPLIPASNLKLFTTAASLTRLGIDYRFKTGIYTAEPPINGVVNGDIYIKGFGDPFLVNEQMWMLTHELNLRGLKKITGDIVADETFFDLKKCAAGWDIDKAPYWYNAEISALSFNFNTVTLFLKPGPKPGYKAIAKLDPDISHVRLTNEAITANKGKNKDVRVMRDFSGGLNLITVKGRIPIEYPPTKIYRAVKEPAIYTAKAFKGFLMREGIEVVGKVKKGTTPQDAFPFYIHESKPLSRIGLDLNKISNNFIAEQILKTMGAEIIGRPGTNEKGIRVIKETFSEIGFDLAGLEMFDGSGLSSLNRLPVRLICDLLLYMANSDKFGPEFMASLAVAGQDGTMKDRPGAGMIRAKTGRIRGVSALSGYLWTVNGNPLIFSILMNGRQSQMEDFLTSQDRILSILYTIDDLCL